jgi:hypothetical protein
MGGVAERPAEETVVLVSRQGAEMTGTADAKRRADGGRSGPGFWA